MATEKEAIERGYVFTGVYDWDREKVKARQKEFTGYKTLLVSVPPSKLSRSSHGMGYSIYIEPRYERDQRAEHFKKVVADKERRLAAAKKDYEDALAKIELDIQDAQRELDNLEGEAEELSTPPASM